MRCPGCAALDDKVVDSRQSEDGASIRRRRECLPCGRRFTTFERLEEISAGRGEAVGGPRALRPRQGRGGDPRGREGPPVTDGTVADDVAAAIEDALRVEGRPRFAPTRSGGPCSSGSASSMRSRAVRFASVYKGFEDLADFEREVTLLAKRTAPKQPDPSLSRLSGTSTDAAAEEQAVLFEDPVEPERSRGAGGPPTDARWELAARQHGTERQAPLVNHIGGDEVAVEVRAALAEHEARAPIAERGEASRGSTRSPPAQHDIGDRRRAPGAARRRRRRTSSTIGRASAAVNSGASGSRSSERLITAMAGTSACPRARRGGAALGRRPAGP